MIKNPLRKPAKITRSRAIHVVHGHGPVVQRSKHLEEEAEEVEEIDSLNNNRSPSKTNDVYLYTKLGTDHVSIKTIPDYMKFIKEFQEVCEKNEVSSMIFVNTEYSQEIKGYLISNMFTGGIDRKDFNWRHRLMNPSEICKLVNLKELGSMSPEDLFEFIQGSSNDEYSDEFIDLESKTV